MSAATDLQATINRFASTVGFTPLAVDGAIGPLTATALYGVLGWISTDTSLGLAVQLKDNIPQIKTSAAGLTIYLNQNAEGLPPPTVAITTKPKTGAAAAVFEQPTSILKNKNAAAAGLLGLGLPDWAVYAGGVGLVAVIGLMIAKRKKGGGVSGYRLGSAHKLKVGDRVTNGDENGTVSALDAHGLVYVQWDADKGRKDTSVWKHTKRTDSLEPADSLVLTKSGGVSGYKPKQNAYGLTLYRWWRAAGFTRQPSAGSAAYDAWYRGEDPSDWRAEQQSRY